MTEPRLVALGRRRHAWCHGQWPIRNHLRTDATFCSQESDHSDQHFAIHNLMRRLSKRATAQMLVDLVAHPDPRHHLVHRPLFRSMAPKIAVPQKLVHISNDPDYTHMSVDVFQNTGFAIGASHFIHSLQGAGKYEILEVYGHKDKTFTTSVVQFGVNLCGHEGVVHGGCIATVIDELFQWTAYWTTGRIGYTANLNVNYRRPLPVERPGILTAEFEKKDGRKVRRINIWTCQVMLSHA
ncbi:hypothetical protein, variant 2 [Aphanomyces invadans]|uniref:Thioesterase domain-containing protein n=1 Tax=Aphanomyces invadans TaxID=157072 RepID=A0A024UPV9_9STRA|nr:hypothetical protein, variant 2 [Aphanomyces invadans]ETW07877.1 hypothetical protein, variant 2 [Aphanomyces invadans]|eukprot:XP_008863970.1 hypothetical protein, variant 2 [Aphanomyces invadans]